MAFSASCQATIRRSGGRDTRRTNLILVQARCRGSPRYASCTCSHGTGVLSAAAQMQAHRQNDRGVDGFSPTWFLTTSLGGVSASETKQCIYAFSQDFAKNTPTYRGTTCANICGITWPQNTASTGLAAKTRSVRCVHRYPARWVPSLSGRISFHPSMLDAPCLPSPKRIYRPLRALRGLVSPSRLRFAISRLNAP